jgi:hypothetical protein
MIIDFRAFGRFNPHWANTRLSVDGTLLVSSLPQHFSTTQMGKGGFAVSFYVLLWNAVSATAEVPTVRSVRKLPCKQGLLVTQRTCVQSSLCLKFQSLCQSASNIRQHPSRVVTTRLCYRSEIPSLWHRCPVFGRHSNWVTRLVFGSDKWQHRVCSSLVLSVLFSNNQTMPL